MPIFSPKKSAFQSRIKRFNTPFDWQKAKKPVIYLVIAGFLLLSGVFLYFSKDLPSPGKMNDRLVVESTKIYDRTGEHILYDIHGEEKRTVIKFADIPESVRYATISLEDQTFYSHHGIKLSSIVRAALKDILHRGVAQGGSTITQQFIKNSILSSERTLTRKIKEVILSLELEQRFTKDEILEMYLNEIPYGSNAYGIEAAAQTFFGIHAKDLNLAQSTLLASLPQAPTYFSPYGSHPEELKARQEYALKQMTRAGYITQEQMEEAKAVDVLSQISPQAESISAPHFVMYVKEYLEKTYGEQLVEQGGLKVYTTLDWDKQQAAEDAVKEGAENNTKKYKATNAALVAIDPKTGQILSMVGSKDYFDKSIDGQVNVTIRDRQPGSSIKPYVYLKAFEKGFTPDTLIWDVDTNFNTDSGKDYNPKNYDNKNRGPLKMKEALAMSLNVPAVKTLYLAGVKESTALAKKLGITTLNQPDRYGLSLVLGGGEVKLLDHTNAFATLATGGIYRPKTAILKVQDKNGNILEQYQNSEGNRVIEEKYVAALDSIMTDNSLRAPVFGDNNPLKFTDRPVAAKTGTTNEWRDGWTMGYTPSLAVGVWAGNNDNSTMAQGADGVLVAAPIWRKFMDQALKNYTVENFPKYDKIDTGKDVLDGDWDFSKETKVCKIPGEDNYCSASDACPSKEVKKKKFFTGHDTLYYVNKDDPQGETPKNPEDDPQYKTWEKAVQKWADKEDDYESSDKAPERDCKSSDFEDYYPEISIENVDVSGSTIKVKGKASAGSGIKQITVSVDGNKIGSTSDSSFSFDYDATSKKGSEVSIEAKVTDKNGNSKTDTKSAHIPL